MFYRKDAVFIAVAGILASAGFAVAENTAVKTPALTLDPVVVSDASAPSGPLMMGFDKIGVGDPLKQAGLNIYGWVEGGYTYDHRHHKTVAPTLPGPFNHEFGASRDANGTSLTGFSGGDRNHFMLNQVDVRFERLVKSDKWDVGGLIEVQYGTDAAGIHSNGLAIGNDTYSGRGGNDFGENGGTGSGADDRFSPEYQFDLTQAYVDVNIPVGNGLKMRAGKFVTLMGYETIDPRGNPFYSHSYLFSAIPFTHTGLVGFYSINDQWAVAGGFTRGWDQSLEDNNGCAIDTIGQVIFTPNKQWSAILNWSVGPENDRDSSHYRTAIDAIVVWQATDKLKLGLETIYVYDGGRNADGQRAIGNDLSHAYGDQWGAALYGQYVINDYVTANVRLEKFHDDAFNLLDGNLMNVTNASISNATSTPGFAGSTVNFYSLTTGVTIKPFPKDPIGKNLAIRPELRYTYSDGTHPFIEGNNTSLHAFKDQFLMSCDVIFGF